MDSDKSIFETYYTEHTLIDRFESEPDQGVDVIIPTIHTNELWRVNLMSIYREVPVRRLLLGDGGCIDDSVDIAKEFPRVEIHDHTEYVSLGFSIRKLIESVESDWFVYFHSDVYLPDGWFDTMVKYQDQYDWFECNQRLTVLVDYFLDYDTPAHERAFSGSQMGRKSAFEKVLPKIDDDYLYRNEDLIFAYLLEQEGKKYGRVDETFHYHQHMFKPSKWERRVKRLDVHLDLAEDEEIRALLHWVKSTVKYMKPKHCNGHMLSTVVGNYRRLATMEAVEMDELDAWIEETDPDWKPYFNNGHTFFSFQQLLFRIKENWYSVVTVYKAGGVRELVRRGANRSFIFHVFVVLVYGWPVNLYRKLRNMLTRSNKN